MGPKVYQHRSIVGVFELVVSANECELHLKGEILGIYKSTTAALHNVVTVIASRYESDIIESLNIPTELSEWEKTAG